MSSLDEIRELARKAGLHVEVPPKRHARAGQVLTLIPVLDRKELLSMDTVRGTLRFLKGYVACMNLYAPGVLAANEQAARTDGGEHAPTS